MCTIVVLHGVHPLHPLAIVANRDEVLLRPSTEPRVLRERPRAIGGLDLESGGTWMGANEHGVFAAITNQRAALPPDRTRRSRGEVVVRALEARDASAVEAQLRALDPRDYNGFNLVFGTVGDVRVAYARDDRDAIGVERVPPGIVVLPNDRLRSPEFPKIARAESRARDALHAPSLEGALTHVLADHDEPPPELVVAPPGNRFPAEILRRLQALCIHMPFYGTVSSSVMLFDQGGRVARYLFAPGPPCVTPYADVSSLFSQGSERKH